MAEHFPWRGDTLFTQLLGLALDTRCQAHPVRRNIIESNAGRVPTLDGDIAIFYHMPGDGQFLETGRQVFLEDDDLRIVAVVGAVDKVQLYVYSYTPWWGCASASAGIDLTHLQGKQSIQLSLKDARKNKNAKMA